ncbi:MAG: hypothetical protein Q7R81_05180 [Candidatus Peregrinibacteria bacterium]|nr:hypothetical protein [Candidatus Peregrinibacteria bacterium]
MATQICRMCKQKIPLGAKKCGKCGSDLRSWPRRHPLLTGLLSIVGFVILVNALGGSSHSATDASVADSGTQQTAPAPIAVSAVDLYAAYEANAIAADDQYDGKTLAVSGTVDSIGKDILDTPYVALQTGNIIFSVQCMLSDDVEASQAATLSKGARITVVGRNSGKLGNIILRDCVIQ